MFENKIGLEAEFFLLDSDNNVVLRPRYHGFDTDDLPVLVEIRAEPGKTPAEAAANLVRKWLEAKEQAANKNLTIGMLGYDLLSPQQYASVLRDMGTKNIAQCNNIYGTDILEYSDQVTEAGKIVGIYVSAGLHIHFSSNVVNSKRYTNSNYSQVDLPISVGGVPTEIQLWKKGTCEEHNVSVSASRITNPVIETFVKALDTEMLEKYKLEPNLKYRLPGWYETKSYGFEYRSLPFTEKVMEDIFDIAKFAFGLFDIL